ncbi:hypothetical protein BDP27DRAFT_1438218 [Rhodocollybia butyracea]|uniref:DUF6532 domain-containing protein n=1 Tax=Rhodocollybia butyracea TaxID=206335 RepID=A0A9P5P3I6_9AGAR|nr:hypothetical protein BDP27DRAFT_1438218 [Rhodocollybia butyracea]
MAPPDTAATASPKATQVAIQEEEEDNSGVSGMQPPEVRANTDAFIICSNMFPASDVQINWAIEIWKKYSGIYITDDELPIKLTEEMKTMDPVAWTRYMQNPIIFQSICMALFYGKQAYGNHQHVSFDLMPVEAMAFLFAIIEHCLSQWKEGYYSYIKLDENISEPVYRRHLARISKWIDLDNNVMESICHKWFVLASRKSGALSQGADTNTKMSNKDRTQAITELVEFSFDNSDAEREDNTDEDHIGCEDKGNTSDDQEDNFNFDGSDGMNESTGRTETGGSKNLKRGCPTSSLAVELKKKKQ